VGDGPASNGVLSMSGTSQLSANYLTVAGYGADGELATGVVNLSGSAKMTLGRDVSIGSYYYTDGAVNVAGDATLDIGRRLNIGDNSSSTYPDAVGTGALNIKENGTVNTPEMRLGKYQYGVGTTTVSSATGTATLNVGGSMTIGWSGGTGTLVVDAGGTVNHGADWVAVGSEARTGFTSTGTVIMNGGIFSHTDATTGIAIGIDGQTGAWTQNGGALISDGPIRFGHDGGSASLSLNGGIFQTPSLAVDSESAPIVARVAFNGGTLKAGAAGDLLVDAPSPVLELDVQSGGAVIDSNSFDVTIGSDLTEDTSLPGGGLTKLGQGTLTLAGDNSYTGLTSIASGGLAVRGSITSDVAIADGASLAADGMVDGDVTGVAGAHVRPGVGIGSLAVTGNLTLHGTLDVEYDGDNDTIDVLAVSGELDLSDATLSFSNLGASPLSNGVYVLATYGSLAGSAGSELGLVGDSFIDYAYGGNSIALVAVPEPSIAITILWLLAFAGARRVRTRQS
jgi:autotransporter-associated beta strand protein